MKIGGLQKVTLVDYPGKIACTVFLSGCNFRCPFCYSKELVLPIDIKKQPEIDPKQFFSFLKERKGMIDACVLCGGEPTINNDLKDFIKKIKEIGYLIK
ncbi:MAG: radical SAM protein, partial [Candidatus Pacebacteria bacterium]|nr:radical SAM protein [Candidatus Paceibacterota bacterium]